MAQLALYDLNLGADIEHEHDHFPPLRSTRVEWNQGSAAPPQAIHRTIGDIAVCMQPIIGPCISRGPETANERWLVVLHEVQATKPCKSPCE